MSAHTATTLAYVRTSAGVVKVDPGQPLPDEVLDGEVDRLGVALEVTPAEKPAGKGRSGNRDQSNGS